MGIEFIQNYFTELTKTIGQIPMERVESVVGHIYRAYQEGKQVFILGNGGSAATASHFCCDLSKGKHGVRLRLLSLLCRRRVKNSFGLG